MAHHIDYSLDPEQLASHPDASHVNNLYHLAILDYQIITVWLHANKCNDIVQWVSSLSLSLPRTNALRLPWGITYIEWLNNEHSPIGRLGYHFTHMFCDWCQLPCTHCQEDNWTFSMFKSKMGKEDSITRQSGRTKTSTISNSLVW